MKPSSRQSRATFTFDFEAPSNALRPPIGFRIKPGGSKL
jgi:hypothetical protein